METWKEIPDTNGLYFVSSHGQIRSADRTFIDNKGRKKHIKGKMLSPVDNGNGYKSIHLHINGKIQKKYIHRLVAVCFCEKPLGCEKVNHKDFDPANNRAENLEWVTSQENYDYSAKAGHYVRNEKWRFNLKEGLKRNVTKPVVGMRISDGLIIRYAVLNDCVKDGFIPSCVSNCCNSKRLTHKGYLWSYDNGR